MKRELRIRELQLLDGAKRKFMHHQQMQKEADLGRLDDEISRKVCAGRNFFFHSGPNFMAPLIIESAHGRRDFCTYVKNFMG